MIYQLHPFELYVLRQFLNKNWYYPNIMNLLFNQQFNPNSSDYAIYSLRSNGFLNTYYDNFGQYFVLTQNGHLQLSSQNVSFTVYNPSIDRPHIPTLSELQSMNLTKQQDDELKQKTLENLELQKENFKLQKESLDSQKGKTKFDKAMTIFTVLFAFLSLLVSIVTALSSNYEIMYKIIKNTIANEKPAPNIKPIKK
jgi:hypothetical protein